MNFFLNQLNFLKIKIRVEIPDTYKKVCKEICEADANAVDLKKMNKYFYEFGRYLIGYDRVDTVGPLLFEVISKRKSQILFNSFAKTDLPPTLQTFNGLMQS